MMVELAQEQVSTLLEILAEEDCSTRETIGEINSDIEDGFVQSTPEVSTELDGLAAYRVKLAAIAALLKQD